MNEFQIRELRRVIARIRNTAMDYRKMSARSFDRAKDDAGTEAEILQRGFAYAYDLAVKDFQLHADDLEHLVGLIEESFREMENAPAWESESTEA